MNATLYASICQQKARGEKQFVVLIDPDEVHPDRLDQLVFLAEQANVDAFFIGGSLILKDHLSACIKAIKGISEIPVYLFPGSIIQVSDEADAILYLSLISGRNPDLLIGRQIEAAPFLFDRKLEVIPTGYMLVDGGAPTSASYMSHTLPIPHDKPDIALCTAMAGELLGLRLIYMDSGSGAKQSVSPEMIKRVSSKINIPIIVGGGIRTPEAAIQAANA
ncbi:MAG: geranylgeranylglyceryl/heptaprenylglyceryl phosphate synthase, partial [Bacteroidota bacterium]